MSTLDQRYLLDDEAMRRFILNGYVTIRTEVPSSLFDEAYRQIHGADNRAFGNDLPGEVPALMEVLRDPVVRGVLVSILGPGYRMASHRHCHHSPPQPADASPGWHVLDEHPFHKDATWPAQHRCRRVMSVFYPHECTPDMGPTAVIPGSQYYTRSFGAYGHDAIQTAGPAGTITFVHYDMWHGGTCNYSDKHRYMMKFVFERFDEPTSPSWNCQDRTWRPVQQGPSGDHHPRLWQCMWDWYCGTAHNGNGHRDGHDVPHLIEGLRHDDERISLYNAYALAQFGERVVGPLRDQLVEESEESPHENLNGRKYMPGGGPFELYYAGYALAAIGPPAVPALAELLQHPQWWVRAAAADVLREMGRPASAAAGSLIQALQDDDKRVRNHAAKALGTAEASFPEVTAALIEQLSDEEADAKVESAGALARIKPADDTAVRALISALENEHVYVRGNAAAALERIGTEEARRSAAEFHASHPGEVCIGG